MNEFMWLRDGRKCRVLGWANNHTEAFVAPQVTREYLWGDECEIVEEDSQIISVPADWVFDSPPTEVLSAEVKELEAEVAALKDEVRAQAALAKRAEEEHAQRMGRIAHSSKALTKLEEYMAGKITYYVIAKDYYHPDILTVDETIVDHWGEKEGRLLSLKPKKGRELVWKLSAYPDGSGDERECIPCTSYEEALAQMQDWIDEQATSELFKSRVIGCAQKYNLVLPKGYVDRTIEAEMDSHRKQRRASETAAAESLAKKKERWNEWRESA